MVAGVRGGSKMRLACPNGYLPQQSITEAALAIAAQTGAQIAITEHPTAAVMGADAVYTDVWASMGQEAEAAERAEVFAPYPVNQELLAHAAASAVFMHC